MERRTTETAPVYPERESRQEVIFNADGSLTGARTPQGRWPLFTGGDIFEIWASLVFASPVPITVTVIRFPVGTPAAESAVLLGTFVIPAETYVYEYDCDWDISRGDQVSFAIQVPELGEGVIPGSGLMLIARVS